MQGSAPKNELNRRFNPPKGHGTDPLLSLGNLVLDVVPTSLLSDVIVVEGLALKGMSLNLVRDKQGRLGLDELVKFDENTGADPAVMSFSFQLKQPGKLPSAYFGTVAKLALKKTLWPQNRKSCYIQTILLFLL